MNAETYDDLKQYVGSKNSFTDDLLNMGYSKGKKDGYQQGKADGKAEAIDEFKTFIRSNKHYFVGNMAEMLIYEFEQMQKGNEE